MHDGRAELMPKKDLIIAPLGEALLILIAALAGFAAHQPLVFTSLGPTAYELIETPHRRSAQISSVLGGHAIAIAAGYLAVFATGAWWVHPVSAEGVPLPRVWAAIMATALTVFFTRLVRVSQPAALSTTLLIALGSMQQPKDAGIIFAAVVLMLLLGEPLRRLRLRHQQEEVRAGKGEAGSESA